MVVIPLTGTPADRKPISLADNPQAWERGARFSPDGRWFFSYVSDESGQNEIYVRGFDPASASASGGKWMVSAGGGDGAHWRGDGKELFYIHPDNTVMAVDVSTSPAFKAGVPKALFKGPFGVPFTRSPQTASGFLMLMPVASGDDAPPSFTVLLNWTSTLSR